jgi:hypothetical protein
MSIGVDVVERGRFMRLLLLLLLSGSSTWPVHNSCIRQFVVCMQLQKSKLPFAICLWACAPPRYLHGSFEMRANWLWHLMIDDSLTRFQHRVAAAGV